MDLNKFAKRAYVSAVKRGKILTGQELHLEATAGIASEFLEFKKADEFVSSDHLPQYSEAVEELADLAIVAMTELYRRGVDVEKVLHEKMSYNERRRD